MSLNYRLYFETEATPEQLVELMACNKAGDVVTERQPLPAGTSFSYDGLRCAFVTEDAEDRVFAFETYGFSPDVHLAARLEKSRFEKDLSVFKRLVGKILQSWDGEIVLVYDDSGVVLRRHLGVGTIEPSWSDQFDDLLPLLELNASVVGTLDFALHWNASLSPDELVDMIAKVGLQERQPLAHFTKGLPDAARDLIQNGSGVTLRRPSSGGMYFQFDGVSCLLVQKDEEDRNAALAMFGFTPTVHLLMHLAPQKRFVQLPVMKHLVVTVLDTLFLSDAVLVAFPGTSVVLSRLERVGTIEPAWSQEFADMAPVLGKRWSVGSASNTRQDITLQQLSPPPPIVFYFGAAGRHSGHHLYTHTFYQPVTGALIGLPWNEIDGALCPAYRCGGTPSNYQVQGLARIHYREGWTALAFWDRSLDVRPGSNSVFFARGEYIFEHMKVLAQQYFPEIWSRWVFDVRLDTSSSAEPETESTLPMEYRLYLATDLSPEEISNRIIGNTVNVSTWQQPNGVGFAFQDSACLISRADAEARAQGKARFAISATVHFRIYLQAGRHLIIESKLVHLLALLKHIVIQVLRHSSGDAVLIAFNDESVILDRHDGIGVLNPKKVGEFGDWLPLLGQGWSTGEQHWRTHPQLRGRFIPEHPDDLQVIVHDGGPRITDKRPEAVWVTVTDCHGDVFTGRVLNQPTQLHTVQLGQQIRFIMPAGSEYPVLVTEKYLRERPLWTIDPCQKCGFSELFDAPSELKTIVFSNSRPGDLIEAFTSICPLCGGIQMMKFKEASK